MYGITAAEGLSAAPFFIFGEPWECYRGAQSRWVEQTLLPRETLEGCVLLGECRLGHHLLSYGQRRRDASGWELTQVWREKNHFTKFIFCLWTFLSACEFRKRTWGRALVDKDPLQEDELVEANRHSTCLFGLYGQRYLRHQSSG